MPAAGAVNVVGRVARSDERSAHRNVLGAAELDALRPTAQFLGAGPRAERAA